MGEIPAAVRQMQEECSREPEGAKALRKENEKRTAVWLCRRAAEWAKKTECRLPWKVGGDFCAPWQNKGGRAAYGLRRRYRVGSASEALYFPENEPGQKQLLRYAEAFEELAQLFRRLPCQRERLSDDELGRIFEHVREQACTACKRTDECWEKAYLQNCRQLYGLLSELDGQGKFNEETLHTLDCSCARSGQVVFALQEGYEDARQNLLWENRMLEQRQAAGEQIRQTAALLRRTAQGFYGDPRRERQIFQRLGRELRWLDTEACGIRVYVCEEGRTEIYLTLRARRGASIPAKEIAEALSDCCGEKMRPAWDCLAAVSDVPANFHFVPETRYQMFCGIARITKTGEMVSGDSYAFLQKDTGKVVMTLADGMGSGVPASRESEKVIELVEQFLDAGFPQETAVRMINSCLLMQNMNRIFSTIDLCMVDLYNAECDMIKSGAADTFLCTGSGTEVIHSSSFPVGVMQQADYAGIHRRLDSGACIVMMTDGAAEALPAENREAVMAQLIRKCRTPNAQDFARSLMERIYLMQRLKARDDMTILTGTLWEKG